MAGGNVAAFWMTKDAFLSHRYRTTDLEDFPLCQGRNWSVSVDGGLYRGTKSGLMRWSRTITIRRGFGPVFLDLPAAQGKGRIVQRYAPEIMIEARNRTLAQRALNLIRASSAVLNGDMLMDIEGWITSHTIAWHFTPWPIAKPTTDGMATWTGRRLHSISNGSWSPLSVTS